MLSPEQTVSQALKAFQESSSSKVNEFLANYFAQRIETPLFLHVTYNDDVYLVDCSQCRNDSVKELRLYLERFLSKQLADAILVPEIRLGHVQVASDAYIVSQIMKPFASVVCISQSAYNIMHAKLLESAYCTLSRTDFKDSHDKWITVHSHKHGHAAIRFGVGNTIEKTLLYTVDELRALHSGSTLDILLDDNGQWFMKVEMERETPESEDLFAFKVHIKSASDKKASVWRLTLAPNAHGKLVYRTVEQTVDPDNDSDVEFVDYSTLYKLPKVVQRSGGDIDLTPPPTPQMHTSTGDSVIDIYCTNDSPEVTVAQAMYARDGKFTVYFTLCNLTFHNTSDDPIAVLKTTLDYQESNGQWKPLENVRIGEPYHSGWNVQFSWQETGSNFNMLEGLTTTLGVIGSVSVEGEPGSDNNARARIPKNFPQPLKLRITIHDKNSQTKSLVVEKANPPKDVVTKEYLESSWSTKINDFVYCDDTDRDERMYFATYLSGRSVVLRIPGTYYTYDSNSIKTMEYAAREGQITEQPYDDLSYLSESNRRTVTFLYDANNDYRFYGIRVALSTSTSKIVTEVPLPQCNPADYFMELRSEPRSGKPTKVFFDLKIDATQLSTSDSIVIGDETGKDSTGSYLDGVYVYNAEKLHAGEVDVPAADLEKGKKYVAKYISYQSSQVIAWTKPFTV